MSNTLLPAFCHFLTANNPGPESIIKKMLPMTSVLATLAIINITMYHNYDRECGLCRNRSH